MQNADLIVEYIYKGFNTINTAATSSNMDFLPAGHKVTYSISIQESLLHDVVQADHWYQGWIRFWEHVGAGETRHAFTYTISQDAVKMFYPHAVFPSSTNVMFHGSMNVFAHETNVNIHKRIVAYDIKELGKNMQTLSMMIVLENIWDRVAKNRAKGLKT